MAVCADWQVSREVLSLARLRSDSLFFGHTGRIQRNMFSKKNHSIRAALFPVGARGRTRVSARCTCLLSMAIFCAVCVPSARATDPPHDAIHSILCGSCHLTHNAPGGAITAAAGNPNLCQTCHMAGGSAAAKPFAESDQAYPRVGLPSGQSASGTSHRWDSGTSGHVEPVGTITSTGKVESGGSYTGRYAKTYTITISTAGAVGMARFSWTDTLGGSGTNLLTGTGVALELGITVTFTDGTPAPSFALNNQWRIYVRPDIAAPTSAPMLARLDAGKAACSTCHDQHSQAFEPFDPAAPAYGGAGTGEGRHDQRVASNTDQMCVDCHSARNVTASSAGSHPVNVSIPAGEYKAPTTVPLDKTTSKVQCSTCHDVHYSPTTNGSLLRVANVNSLCTDCHLNSNTANGAHFNATTGALWPGGQYGSTYPQISDATQRGYCVNCHNPHGWPDDVTPANDFPHLTVERSDQSDAKGDPGDAEDLCFTCHDGAPLTNSNLLADFAKTTHHPVKDSEQFPGRSVECRDCHNAHKAQAGAHTYSTTATSWRNLASNPIKSVAGVSVAYGTTYTTGTATFTASSATVTGAGTAWTSALIGEKIRRSSDGVDYTITAVASGTSLTISPAYAGTTGSAQAYVITLGNFVAPPASGYAAIPATTGIAYEYQLCFRCHSIYGFTSYSTGTATFTSASATVTGSGTSWNAGLVGSTMQRASDTATYTVTAVASATSLTITPAYAGATGSGQTYAISNPPPNLTPIYNTGTATFTSASATIAGSGTTWNAGMVGHWIRRGTETTNYEIAAVASATSMTITPAYVGTTGSAQAYKITGATNTAQEFSPNNKSGHPVVTGLDNYPNSIPVGSPLKKGMQTAEMKAPWNTNVGTQTMMCSDCHNTDAASPAAQGPHGSAAQFMLRGANAANWPNVTLTNRSTSWCMNCHNGTTNVHSTGDHSSQRCYACHIVIPHGGKISRLIGDRDTMPARYAYNNTLTTMQMTKFKKAAASSYTKGSTGNCSAACATSDHPAITGTNVEDW